MNNGYLKRKRNCDVISLGRREINYGKQNDVTTYLMSVGLEQSFVGNPWWSYLHCHVVSGVDFVRVICDVLVAVVAVVVAQLQEGILFVEIQDFY